jgi:hypothetical protein
MESGKYKLGGNNDAISGDGGTLATVYEKGSKLGLEPLDYGDSSLVGLWTFDEGTGSTAYDYSGKNVTGGWSGSGYGSGEVGPYAGSFSGSNYVDTGLATPHQITTCAWNKLNSSTSEYPVVDTRRWHGNAFVISRTSSTFYGLFYNSDGSSAWSSYSPLPAGFQNTNWQLWCFTSDNNVITKWVNGQAIASSTTNGSGLASSNGMSIGIGYYGVPWFFNGSIDDVRIYNRALSAAEIAAMYAGGK